MLVDSNTALRTFQPAHPQYKTAVDAILILSECGEELCTVPQNLIEVWAVATRPTVPSNGLGMTTEEAARAIGQLKDLFTLLAEREETYAVWESLVVQHRVSGKATHDARIVAAMKVHGLNSILTCNTADFTRYPGIEVVHPADVATPA